MPSSTSNNKRLGITLGDPGGIGAEIVARSLAHPAIARLNCTIIGDSVIFRKFAIKESRTHQLIACDHFARAAQIKATITRENGVASLNYLYKAIGLLKARQIDALVTAPVCKEAIALTHKDFTGHTEFLAQQFSRKSVDMMFVCDQLRVVIATRHIPVQKISRYLTRARLIDCIKRTHESLKRDFKIRSPRIAVCGLNPHAGEGGTIGLEERRVITPVLNALAARGLKLIGPASADTIFIKENRQGIDAIVAMYHDQGLIAAKTLFFDKLVNVTIGLPFVRTSPDHGTAFDIAGKKKANPSSMIEAIKLAHQLA